MKVDVFNHFLPAAYRAALERHAGAHPVVRYARRIRPLRDVEERLRTMERCRASSRKKSERSRALRARYLAMVDPLVLARARCLADAA